MPKIIKNGKEYSGVPIEVVTAWAPTADPVQVKEPLMGNTDVSSIGDGTVTGAISAVKSGLSALLCPTIALTSADDMNAVDCGTYYQDGYSTPTNSPTDAHNAFILVVRGRSVDRFQFWVSRNTGNIYYRTTNNWSGSSASNWTAWKTITAS